MTNKITQAEQSPSYNDIKNNPNAAERQRAWLWIDGYNTFLKGGEPKNNYKDGSKRDVTWRNGYNKAIEESDSDVTPIAIVKKKPKTKKQPITDLNGNVVDTTPILPTKPYVAYEDRPNTGFGGSTARIFGRNMGKTPRLVEADGTVYTGSLTLKTFPDPIPDCIPKFMRKHFSNKVTLTLTNDGRYFDASGFPVDPPNEKEIVDQEEAA